MLALSETRGSKRFLRELTCRGRLIFTRKSTTAPLTIIGLKDDKGRRRIAMVDTVFRWSTLRLGCMG